MINGFISKHKEIQEYSSSILDFIGYFKFINAYTNYTVESLKQLTTNVWRISISILSLSKSPNLIKDKEDLADLINNTRLKVELDIYTPDHKYCPKHTFVMKYKETEDTTTTMYVRVYSKDGLVKKYSIPAKGISMEVMSDLIDKERKVIEMVTRLALGNYI